MLPNFLKIKEEPAYVRDTGSNAIIATDLQEKRKYLETQKTQSNIAKIEGMGQKIASLEEKMDDLKRMLETLINKSVG